MKFQLYIEENQITYLADLIDEDKSLLSTKIHSMIDKEEIEEWIELIYSDIYRSIYTKEINRLRETLLDADENLTKYVYSQKLKTYKESASKKALHEHDRIKMNNKYMPVNQEFETLIDIICHSNLDWMDNTSFLNKVHALSDKEIAKKKSEKNKSFATKKIQKNISNAAIDRIQSTVMEDSGF